MTTQQPYDNEDFFKAYATTSRQAHGLAGAGEWHLFKRILPPFLGQRVLDLGCGYGWHCKYAIDEGAVEAVGIDASSRMIAEAVKRHSHPQITYQCVRFEDYSYPPAEFDTVMSVLALHYTEQYAKVVQGVYRTLKPGGTFVFMVEHPVTSAEGSQKWILTEDGKHSHWPVDRYFEEGAREGEFCGYPIVRYHRTIETYINTLLGCGFRLTRVLEPTPDIREHPEWSDDLRKPAFVAFAVTKP